VGKILASYLVKMHLHEPDEDADGATAEQLDTLTNEDVKAAIVNGVSKELSVAEVTVSLIERTDSD